MKEEQKCTHYWEYVKTELQQEGYGTGSLGSANLRQVDLVICKKCGQVKRN